jgi:hypothetical protein
MRIGILASAHETLPELIIACFSARRNPENSYQLSAISYQKSPLVTMAILVNEPSKADWRVPWADS